MGLRTYKKQLELERATYADVVMAEERAPVDMCGNMYEPVSMEQPVIYLGDKLSVVQ